MISLPNYTHTKKVFEKISNPICTSPKLSDEIINDEIGSSISKNFLFRYRNSLSRTKRNNSNILDIVIHTYQLRSTFFLIFYQFILPNILAFSLCLALVKIEKAFGLYCSEGAESSGSYNKMRRTVTNNFLFVLATYLCLFEEKLTAKINFFGAFIFIFSFVIIFLLRYYRPFTFNGKEILADYYCVPIFFQILVSIIIFWRDGNFGSRECKKISFILIMCVMGILDLILLRIYWIKIISQGFLIDLRAGKLLLQCFLFIFYQIYGKLVLWLLQKFKNILSQNLFLLIIKIYIANVMSSCVVLPLIKNNGTFINLFSLINFFLQIFSLYKQKNLIFATLSYIFIFLNYFCPIKRMQYKCQRRNISQELTSTIGGSTNGVMLAITSIVLIILISGKTLGYPNYEINEKKNELNDCRYEDLARFMNFGAENLCILFSINLFFFLYLVMKMKDKRKSKLLWKSEKYSLFGKILYFIMLFSYVDNSFQYYAYLYLINDGTMNLLSTSKNF